MSPRARWRPSSLALACALLFACAGPVSGIRPRGIPAEDLPLDLARFMGEWYVLAHIPTAPEAEAHEAVERYTLRDDGTIDVLFTFCEGSVDGPQTVMTQVGWVYDPATNAEWRVRPLWPLALTYQIAELDPDYAFTVVTNPGGYAWVMARTPEVDEARLAAVTRRLAERGFATGDLRRVPHDDGVCGGDA